MADHELIDESEREKFAGTSAVSDRHDRDGDGVDDREEATADSHRSTDGVLDNDYQRGRSDQALEDEHNRPARFNREGDDVAAESASTRERSEQRF
ncbi:hypothetical protein OJ997_09680 [Solirubrobacter phytolaccae]|uniref:Uncharacterized protein n=1 Tax=Solirubrobacter phytolaccae TaxID=1404360 RepID=A0A9X3N964_9ACTN|nr:hypothetical protein [Solirubrobacter phytolaccae]MDA0180562.1 hypothetical protein [Solirubrobacter phytolaccae]